MTVRTSVKRLLATSVAALIAALMLATTVGVPMAQTRYDVTNYGATPNNSSNDSAAFMKAMQAAVRGGGVAYVPSGTYRIANVKPPNHATLDVKATATLKKYGTSGGPLFLMQGPDARTFLKDVHVKGVNGDFMMDLSGAGDSTPGFVVRNVQGFSIKHMRCIQNDSNKRSGPPSSFRPCVSLLPMQSQKLASGLYSAPYDGTLTDLHSTHSPYGWGLMQFTGGQRIAISNISGEGGIPLRLENFQNNWTPMAHITADGVTCINGHAAANFNPHGVHHAGDIHLTNVRADSCEEGLSIGGTGTYGPNVTVSGLTVVAGNTAQVRTPSTNDPLGSWYIGPSKYCVRDYTNSYSVAITNKSCRGLPNG